jgi:hypothetical protein
MKRILILAAFLAAAAAQTASAACYADYKAKKNGGALRLHYGVVQVSNAACNDRGRAEQEVRQKVSSGGWTVLNVMSVFDESGLQQRKQSAAEYFLRF